MLIIFHYLGILIFQILRNRKRLKATKKIEISNNVDEAKIESDLRFDPPVYRQRFSKVYEILIHEKWRNNLKKLVDFGCAEYNLFVYIKNLNVECISFVDIDECLLKEKIGKIEPLLSDRLRRRNCPLEVSVYRGSVIDPDYRLRTTDVVTAIELIEHLYPDTLDAFPYNIFSFIKPKLVIITTPNADFNILFQRLNGFRHADHKFEWSREQFEDWSHNIIARFPDYVVEFCGIGEGPNTTINIGCCSQAATFIRKDVLSENYISSIYARSCQCEKNSLCKGQTTESKLLCKCVCPFCVPDFSVGVCTYLSYNIKDSDAYRPMKADPKKSFSDTNLNKFQLDYKTFLEDKINEAVFSDINPSYNIFFKLIQKIDYPYEIDSRTETEKLLQTFSYRINTFSHMNGRFYVEEKQQCEIPVRDIMYGDIELSVEEVRNLLSKAGYQIEKCIIPEIQESEDCIISMPQEMEDITSSSEVTDTYSSKSSECDVNKKTEANNIELLSDWDEISYVTKETDAVLEQDATTSTLESLTAEPKKPDPLFDSGYLKSPSPLEPQKQLPAQEIPQTEQFEDIVATPNLHLKKSVAKEKFVDIPDSHKSNKVDFNRVNELDGFHDMTTVKTFMGTHLKTQNEFKKSPLKDLSMAGPSSAGTKKPKKNKEKLEKEKICPEKKIFREPTSLDDAKSLTNCIIENSLNKVDAEGEVAGPVILRNLSPLRPQHPLIEAFQPPPQIEPPVERPEAAAAPPQAVENGDLANNNRDNEGNNLVVEDLEEQDIDEGIDLLNDNLEDFVHFLEDNLNAVENNNGAPVMAVPPLPVEEEQGAQARPKNGQNVVDENVIELEADDSVGRASREALYDVNSEQDLLEDFDVPPPPNHDHSFNVMDLGNSVVMVGIHPADSSVDPWDPSADPWDHRPHAAGTEVVPQEPVPVAHGSHDEPHFYCQGDGLGVHPSVNAVDMEETEEEPDNDTITEEESSSNGTVDFAEVDPGPSDMFDASSLPEESSQATSLAEDNTVMSNFVLAGRSQNEQQGASTDERQVIIDVAASAIKELLRAAVDEASRISLTTSNTLQAPIVLEDPGQSTSGRLQNVVNLSYPELEIFSNSMKIEDISKDDSEISLGEEECFSCSANCDETSEYELNRNTQETISDLVKDDNNSIIGLESECEQPN